MHGRISNCFDEYKPYVVN